MRDRSRRLVKSYLEATQTPGEMPRDICRGDAAPAAIGVGQIAEQFRSGTSKRDFQV